MGVTKEDVARAFSEHRFTDAYPFIAADVRWNVVGAAVLPGKQLLMQSCGSMLAELDGVEVRFDRFRVITSETAVVVDSVAHYGGDDPASVAACDIYEFDGELVTSITSYNVEVDTPVAR
ncbi:MAG: nuclear transport factor 2 family protein [Micrococcales bacterium]|nr:nuclear transport factor 2 family protein [Micrococcales bacterium]